jgi:hypothetical protein
LPSSLTRVLPFAFVFSTRLPVSVCGTVSCFHRQDGFSCPCVLHTSSRRTASRPSSRLPPQSTQWLCFPTVFILTPTTGTGLLTRCPSPTPFGLGLGPTNPTRTDLPSETLDFRRTWFSHVSRYSCQHSHFRPLQQPLPGRLHRKRNAPLLLRRVPSFGAMLEPRYIIRAVAFDQ